MVLVKSSIALLCWALFSVVRADEIPDAPEITSPPIPTGDKISKPLHCTTVVVNPLLPEPIFSTHVCKPYTRSLCSNPCGHRPGIMCPAVIKTTTELIPCKTDCCPTTVTVTDRKCSICERCPYQETRLVMTGCTQTPRPDATRTITQSGVTISQIGPSVVTRPARKADPGLPTVGADWRGKLAV